MTIRIGITGGIGSGKSIVSRLFSIMGIPVYISDIESKRLTQEDSIIRQELIALLGEDVYRDGQLNKPFLASQIFGNRDYAKKINQIIHPQVKKDFKRWIMQQDNDLVAIESAILVEAGFTGDVDAVVMVYAPMELRLQRAVKRDTSSEELIRKRIMSQMDDEKKKEHAHFVIYNNDEMPLIPQIIKLIHRLKQQQLS